MLEVDGVTVSYDGLVAVRDVSIEVSEGDFVVLLGPNGAGKTTLLKTVSAVKRPDDGEIRFQGERISDLAPNEVLERGIAHIPEGARIFQQMTVLENLQVGGHLIDDEAQIDASLERVYELFPILEERKDLRAATLSGGQRQMLSIGRSLMVQPDLLLVDEPSLGLAPAIVDDVFEVLGRLSADGMTVLLAEQNVNRAFDLADYGYVLESSELVLEGTASDLSGMAEIKDAYLGLGDVAGP